MLVCHFLVAWVLVTTLGPAYWHQQTHGSYNALHIIISFFLGMNFLVCIWEIGLGINIDHIKSEHTRLTRKVKFHITTGTMRMKSKPEPHPPHLPAPPFPPLPSFLPVEEE